MIDRRQLADDIETVIAATGHNVDVARVPDGAGPQPDGGFIPYVVIWPQPTVYDPTMADNHADDTTTLQLTCVADDADTASRIASDCEVALVAITSDDLTGRAKLGLKLTSPRGPLRDPEDDRLWYCQVFPAVSTTPA